MYSSQIKSRDSDHHFRISTFWIYSVAFALGSLLFFFPYIKNGLSLVDSTDAMQQHYIALSYWGQYLRNLFHDIFVEHTFHIPTWDLSLGYGADIITTLHYYCLGEPLTLLSAFFSPAHTEICYEILIILRLYLAGFFFLMYCRYMNFQRFGALLGALTYTFSGYAAGPCVFHPFFAIPMICFPLLLLGAEKVYRKENPLTFILAVTLAAISNYYFFYMQVLLLIGYLILRYFSFFSPFRLKECMRWIGRFLLYALIGLAIAAPIFIPNISSILQSTRA